jgi:tRNA A-37 threonylcarbamoyl transferase component Bud32
MTLDTLRAAKKPEDIFGAIAPIGDELKTWYRAWAKVAHPDAGGSTELMAKLNDLYRRAQRAQLAGAWGKTTNVGSTFAKGDIANLYITDDGDLLKMPRSPGRNNLMLNEAKMLRKLRDDDFKSYWSYVPELKRSFRQRDPKTKQVRQVNVLSYIEGFYTLSQVKDEYPDGIGGRDMAWMWRRILVAIGYAHKCGVIHGALTPDHILIHPTMHGVILIDWTLSGAEDSRRAFKLPKWEHIYPDTDDDKLTRQSDIYMASMSMHSILHSDATPRPIHAFMKGCRLKSLPSAWRLKSEFDDLLYEIYGPRRYRPFVIPATA